MQTFSGLISLKRKACGSDCHIELASEHPRAATCWSVPSGARGLGMEVNSNSASTKDSPWLRSLFPGTWVSPALQGRSISSITYCHLGHQGHPETSHFSGLPGTLSLMMLLEMLSPWPGLPQHSYLTENLGISKEIVGPRPWLVHNL